MKKIGYQRRDPISHRRYSRRTSLDRFRRTGRFTYVKDGSGHRAGEAWGDKKQIDPNSPVRKYSKNSPSFDEGVWLSKQKRKVSTKKQRIAEKMLGGLLDIPTKADEI